jgi:hypothetical protein
MWGGIVEAEFVFVQCFSMTVHFFFHFCTFLFLYLCFDYHIFLIRSSFSHRCLSLAHQAADAPRLPRVRVDFSLCSPHLVHARTSPPIEPRLHSPEEVSVCE